MTTATRTSGVLRLRVDRRDGRSMLTHASGHVPYAARAVHAERGVARIVLVQTVAGPLAGDRSTIEVEVGPGAAVELVGNAATVALPADAPAIYEVRCRVGPGGTLAWLPEPVVLAARCDLDVRFAVDLETGAAAFLREVVVLGRHGETAGRYRASVRCELDGEPLLHDATRIDGAADSPATLAGARAYASLALLGVEPYEPAHVDEFALARGGRVLRVLAPDAATLAAALASAEGAYRRSLSARTGAPATNASMSSTTSAKKSS